MLDREHVISKLIEIIDKKEVKDEKTLIDFFKNYSKERTEYFRNIIDEENDVIAFLYGVYILEELSFLYKEEDYYMGTYGGDAQEMYHFGLNSIGESELDVTENDFYTFLSKIYIEKSSFFDILDEITFRSGV